ncbi:MAG: energy-coupling factor transporter ATPase [Aeromicrobium sp.]|uniref:ABC transporter ATP-binding protein n=1 Tax=Aeromicrobium sp. TaxID=1871063 RepID=UPI0039E2E7F9
MIELDGVGVRRPGAERPALADLSLSVAAGESVLLLGPSGSGKSTLALTVAGLMGRSIPATVGGTLRVGGSVATVFQDPDAQVVGATVFDDACFGPENLGLPAAEIERRATEALALVGLAERHDADPRFLSGGQRQRLAIAGALAMEAPVLVLDEPSANLDPEGVEEVYAVLARIREERQHTLVLVEHRIDEAIDLVDRLVVLDHDGRIALDGTPEEVLRGPSAERAAALGVWLPAGVRVARQLRGAGVDLSPDPLSVAELTAALDAAVLPDPLPVVPPAVGAEPVLTARGLVVRRGEHEVLSGCDLDVAPGELVAVLGGNGAGKTTLLHALAGLLPLASGSIGVAGVDPADCRPTDLRRRLGVVFQNPEHQIVTARVTDELAHGLRVAKTPPAEIATRVEPVLDETGLRERADAHPLTLSGGQKRRLSVAAELVTGPEVLLLDEPTYGQDHDRARALMDRLAGLRASGTAVVVVTHDLQLVADHATRVVVLDQGRIVADAPPSVVLADRELLTSAGLRPPALAAATAALSRHPAWREVTTLAQIPGGAA